MTDTLKRIADDINRRCGNDEVTNLLQ